MPLLRKIIVWRNNMAVVNFSCVDLPLFKSSWLVLLSVSNINVTNEEDLVILSDFRYDNRGQTCADVLLSIQENRSDFFRMTQRVEKENFWELKFKIFPARGNGPGYRVARCFGNLSPLSYCLDPRLTYINKQIFHAQNTLVRCIALQIFTFSLAPVVVLRNRSQSYKKKNSIRDNRLAFWSSTRDRSKRAER